MGNSCGSKESSEDYLIESLEDHTNAINCIALSEDMSLMATGSEDCTVRMWSTRTNETECLGTLRGHSSYITCVSICDTFVISGAADNTIRKWDMTTEECLFNFQAHKSRISRVICTGEFIFSSSYDKTARAWVFDDVEEKYDDGSAKESQEACVRTFEGHSKGVYSIIFIPAEDQCGLNEEGLNINPGDFLITGSADSTAKSWSFDTGKCLKTYKGHTGPIMTMTTDPNGSILYTGSQDKTIRAWNIQSGFCLKEMCMHEGPVICLTVAERLLFSGSQDGKARCWVREFGDCSRTYKGHKHSIVAMKFDKATGLLYTACGDTCIRAFDAKTGVLKRLFQGHEFAVTCLALVGDRMYSGSFDSTVKVWNIKNINEDPDDLYEEEEEGENGHDFENKQNKRLEDLDKQLDSYVDEDMVLDSNSIC